MIFQENTKILGLSRKEALVLGALQDGYSTPLSLFKKTRISRTAIYAILKNLKARGIVKSSITDGKKHWLLENTEDIEKTLYDAKRQLLKIPEGREELHGLSDSIIVVHRGSEAIKKCLGDMFFKHKNKRLYGFQGNTSVIGWNKVFSVTETNKINQAIKKNGFIVEAVLPSDWFTHQTKLLGKEWAKEFEGRMTRVHTIEGKYFEHGGQVMLFKDSLYLLALNEEIVIEIRHSEIQKMLFAFLNFMQDNSETIDANQTLRKLMGKGTES